MAKDDSGGLLSKVARFVRNPATSWADLDQPETDRDSQHSKQMLKELIERKKRNDFVRKREFEMLRKLRRRELATNQPAAARPSFFQSSLPSRPDERAQTLKKIDEIEAQMSMHWWKTKNRDSTIQSVTSTLSPESAGPQPTGSSSASRPPSLIGHRDAAMASPLLISNLTPLDDTVRSPLAPQRPAVAAQPAASKELPRPASEQSGFHTTAAGLIEVGEFVHDPELEEAAIRFANGDPLAAEAGLMELLRAGAAREMHEETWLTLFDLYRAAGMQNQYDQASMEFVGRFQRSAPQWFSMPQRYGSPAASPAAAPVAVQRNAHWSCAPLLNAKGLQLLQDSLVKAERPWRLDWSRLSTIDPDVARALEKLFQSWASVRGDLQLIGVEVLDRVLESSTPPSDPSVPVDWWHLRMAFLRLMRRMDDFELTALNYCVTYEVSPPSWDEPLARVNQAEASVPAEPQRDKGSFALLDAGVSSFDAQGTDFRATSMDSMMSALPTLELSGDIQGDIGSKLARLDNGVAGAGGVQISCAGLIRVDFLAAGDMLNWVTAHHAQGRHVRFVDVHRLVALFFNVIGISEHAAISLRRD